MGKNLCEITSALIMIYSSESLLSESVTRFRPDRELINSNVAARKPGFIVRGEDA